ncbi:hypothetical protein FOA52_016250 [Chlamydomonas sp. UWO 241]|nr:hypothetical protein FOA52_016250 [Chlamydomonas sp. UWO 241]
MDLIDLIEIPSFQRRQASARRNVALATGLLATAVLVERYTGGMSRAAKSMRRGLTAFIAAWLEDRGGVKLFTLDDENTSATRDSALDLSSMQRRRSMQPGDRQATSAGTSVGARDSDIPSGTPVVCETVVEEDSPYDTGSTAAHTPATGEPIGGVGGSGHDGSEAAQQLNSADTPTFFQSTKFFAVLDVEEANALFQATTRLQLGPHEVLFRAGDPSDSGIFIVVSGSLGVFREEGPEATPVLFNTLRYGESVGDLDVVDGARRSLTCISLDEGCLLVQVSRPLFLEFVQEHPRALLLYLQQGLARLWRVAHFTLNDFLQLSLHKAHQSPYPRPPLASVAEGTSSSSSSNNLSAASVPAAARAIPPRDPLLPSPVHAPRRKEGLRGAQGGLAGNSRTSMPPLLPPSPGFKEFCMPDPGAPGGSPSPLAAAAAAAEEAARLSRFGGGGGSAASTSRSERGDTGLGRQSRTATVQLPWGLGMPSSSAMEGMAARAEGLRAQQAAAAKAAAKAAVVNDAPGPQPLTAETLAANAAACPQADSAAIPRSLSLADLANGIAGGVGMRGAGGNGSGVTSAQAAPSPPRRNNAAPLLASEFVAAAAGAPPLPPPPPAALPRRLSTANFNHMPGAHASQPNVACLADGWDVVSAGEVGLDAVTLQQLGDCGQPMPLREGGLLQDVDWACGQIYLLVSGRLSAQRAPPPPAFSEMTPAGARRRQQGQQQPQQRHPASSMLVPPPAEEPKKRNAFDLMKASNLKAASQAKQLKKAKHAAAAPAAPAQAPEHPPHEDVPPATPTATPAADGPTIDATPIASSVKKKPPSSEAQNSWIKTFPFIFIATAVKFFKGKFKMTTAYKFAADFADAAIESLKESFFDDDPSLDILACFTIFDPVQYIGMGHAELDDFGNDSFQQLKDHFWSGDGLPNSPFSARGESFMATLDTEFKHVKTVIKDRLALTPSATMLNLWRFIARSSNSLMVPNIILLMNVYYVMALHTAEVERGFSIHRILKNRLRSRLMILMVDSLLRIWHLAQSFTGPRESENNSLINEAAEKLSGASLQSQGFNPPSLLKRLVEEVSRAQVSFLDRDLDEAARLLEKEGLEDVDPAVAFDVEGNIVEEEDAGEPDELESDEDDFPLIDLKKR